MGEPLYSNTIAYNYGGLGKYTYEMADEESSNEPENYDDGDTGRSQNVVWWDL